MRGGIPHDDPALTALLRWPWQRDDTLAFRIASELQRHSFVDHDALPDGYRYKLTIRSLSRFSNWDLVAAYQRMQKP